MASPALTSATYLMKYLTEKSLETNWQRWTEKKPDPLTLSRIAESPQ
jgi:hypothetical protein